jgi:hypothetical protein
MADCLAVLVAALGIASLAGLLARLRLGGEEIRPSCRAAMTAVRHPWRPSSTLPRLCVSRT